MLVSITQETDVSLGTRVIFSHKRCIIIHEMLVKNILFGQQITFMSNQCASVYNMYIWRTRHVKTNLIIT